MTHGFVLSPLARQDLLDIWDHIALYNIDAADRLADELEEAMKKLASMPEMGHFRDELADRSHRFWPLGNFLIVYHHEAKPLEIVRVLHGARDVAGLL